MIENKEILFCSSNLNKTKEIQHKIGDSIQIKNLLDVGFTGDIAETEDTFKKNALLKAKFKFNQFEKLHKKLAKLRENLKAKQEELFEMRMKVETLKKLRERQSEEYYREENRKEQLETDEKVALKFASDMVKAQQEADEDVWS